MKVKTMAKLRWIDNQIFKLLYWLKFKTQFTDKYLTFVYKKILLRLASCKDCCDSGCELWEQPGVGTRAVNCSKCGKDYMDKYK